MDSDSSVYNESLVEYVKQKRKEEQEKAKERELEREEWFAQYYKMHADYPGSIFNLPGTNFLRFTPQKIKFSFQPCRVARLVSERVMFFVSLKFRYNSWLIKRDSIPVKYKSMVYSLFFNNAGFRFKTDRSILFGIVEILNILKDWADSEHKFRKRKMIRYRNGEDVYIDQDDEDIFLSDGEIEELHLKREIIWRRMLPPTKPIRQRRRKRPIPLSLSSNS